MKKRAALALSLLLSAGAVHAEELEAIDVQDPAAMFRAATDALTADRPSDAIAKLESLGDHGVVDAVVSYDRGLAYAGRVRGGAEQPGDLGRAAHGFEEARELSRDEALVGDATRALTTVRAEIARRRARAGDPVDLEHGVSLGRSIVSLLPENIWAALAIVFSSILTVAIVVRARVRAQRAKVAATTTCGVAGSLLTLAAMLAFAARDARLHLREAVVVAPNARLLDGRHIARDDVAPVAEGARVRIVEEEGGFSRVVVDGEPGFLASSAVRPIAKR